MIGERATTPFTIAGGGLDNDAAATTVPAGRALVRSTLLGPGGDYSGMYLAGRDLSGVDLTGANLTGANLAGTDLTGANLTGATLSGVTLDGANLTGARLLNTVLSEASGEPAALPAGWTISSGRLVFGGIDVAAGRTTFLSALQMDGDQLVKAGEGTLILTRASTHSGGTYVQAGTLYVHHIHALGTGPLVVSAGATVILDVGFETIELSSLSFASGAMLDIGQARLEIAAGIPSVEVLRAWLAAGRAGGTWAGSEGILSSAAAESPVSYAVGGVVDESGMASLAFTAIGDLDLDRDVDTFDLVQLAAGERYGSSTAATWAEGDMNYDGVTNIFDLVAIEAGDEFGQGKITATDTMTTLSIDAGTTLTAVTTTALPAPTAVAPTARTEAFQSLAAGVSWGLLGLGDQGADQQFASPQDRKASWWRRLG